MQKTNSVSLRPGAWGEIDRQAKEWEVNRSQAVARIFREWKELTELEAQIKTALGKVPPVKLPK